MLRWLCRVWRPWRMAAEQGLNPGHLLRLAPPVLRRRWRRTMRLGTAIAGLAALAVYSLALVSMPTVPCGFLLFAMIAATFAARAAAYQRGLWFEDWVVENHCQVCPECGYSLQGLPSEHCCPECGVAYRLANVKVRWDVYLAARHRSRLR